MTYVIRTSSAARHAANKPELPETQPPKPDGISTDRSPPGWPEPGPNWLPAQKSNAPGWLTDEANRRWRRSRYPRGD